MNDSNKDVEHALDDIFDGEFIDKENVEIKEFDSYDNTSSISFVDSSKNDIKEISKNNDNNFDNIFDNKDIKEKIVDDDLKEIKIKEEKVIENKLNSSKEETTNTTATKKIIVKRKKENKVDKKVKVKEKKVKKTKEKTNKNTNKKFIIIMLFLILLFLLIIFIYNLAFKEKVVICSYAANVKDYKITDRYQISKKANKIQNIVGRYEYKVLNDSFKEQLPYIKEEKLPVIINSNGMDGFTYIYEETDYNLVVNSYLDFTKFDYFKINKINQSKKPISYFNINDKLTYKKLKKDLIKKGYVCK